MKRYISLIALFLSALVICGCSEKKKPAFHIKNDSVTSIEFQKTVFSETDVTERSYVSKTVLQREDIDKLISWMSALKLEKHAAVEIPIENVKYVIVLNGPKEHNLIFLDDYAVFDTAAYQFADQSQMEQVGQKYNMLNYEEKAAELNLMK